MLIIYANTITSVFLQMKDYNNYDNFAFASVIIAHVILAMCLAIIGLLIYRIISFFNNYPKLSENLKKATEIILKDE